MGKTRENSKERIQNNVIITKQNPFPNEIMRKLYPS